MTWNILGTVRRQHIGNSNNEAKEFIEYFREKFEVMHCTEHRSGISRK